MENNQLKLQVDLTPFQKLAGIQLVFLARALTIP